MAALRVGKAPPLAAKLAAFDYQTEAVEAVRDRPYAAVFHEQGLGKTKIAIDVVLHWLKTGAADTVLLVTKKALLQNWRRELAMHSHFTPPVLSPSRSKNFYIFNSPTQVILCNFETIKLEHQRLKLFQKTRKVAAVLDESAKIKNPNSALTKAFLDLAPGFSRRLIMTGTPVANRPFDIWAQVNFLDQGKALGTDFAEFQKTLDLSNDLYDNEVRRASFERALVSIHDRIAGFTVRETKDSGRIQLPDKVFENIYAEWEPRQKNMYAAVRDEARLSVMKDGLCLEDESEDILKRLLRLVQIASNPRLVDEGYDKVPGKWAALAQLIEKIVAEGEKAIVWTTFTENADWLASSLRRFGVALVHGRINIDARNRAIDRFLGQEDCRVLVATPGAAKEGLTLTVANHVIFFDRSFSLDDYLQAQDRIHRVSQTRTCYVYNLLMRDSVDEWVNVLLNSKRIAAQLAQGDITLESYNQRMTYSFGQILRGVLALQS